MSDRQIDDVQDLDLLLGVPQKVKLGGKRYELPADCSAELYLQMIRFSKLAGQEIDPDTEADMLGDLRDGLLELFQIHQPEMTKLPAAMSLDLLVDALGKLYGPKDADPPSPEPTEGSEEAGTKKPTATRKSTSAAKRSRSSSS